MGLEARVCGRSSHLSLCKHIQVAHARTDALRFMHMARRAQRPMQTRVHTRAHAQRHSHTTAGALMNTQVHMQPHAPPTPRFWSPCILSEYCQRLGQRGGQSRLPRNGPSPLCLPTRVKPQGSGLGAEELGFCEGGPEARPLGARGGWCGSQVGAGPLHFDLSSSPRSQDLGRQQRGAGWGRGEEQDNSRRTSSVQYGRLSHYYYNIL